jgi:hypothetical protein
LVDLSANKLICLLLLDDDQAKKMELPEDAFFRAFILEHRSTGKIHGCYRFKYADRRSWYSLVPINKAERQAAIDYLRTNIEKVIQVAAANLFGATCSLREFYPPDDDPLSTVQWLEEEGLITVEKLKVM